MNELGLQGSFDGTTSDEPTNAIGEIAGTLTDDQVIDEQNKSATSLVSNLTTFEQATKVLSSQFQGIETALLQSFGPALGGLVGGIQGAFGAGGAHNHSHALGNI